MSSDFIGSREPTILDTNSTFQLTENKDILKNISTHNNRPKLVVGFAAETNDLEKNAKLKLIRKKCDLIVANNVANQKDPMGGDMNSAHVFNKSSCLAIYKKMKKTTLFISSYSPCIIRSR